MATTRSSTGWEVFQKIMVALLTAGVLASVTLQIMLRVEVRVLQEQYRQIEKRMDARDRDQYNGSDAERDKATVQSAFSEMGARVRSLEAEFREHTGECERVRARIIRLEEQLKARKGE